MPSNHYLGSSFMYRLVCFLADQHPQSLMVKSGPLIYFVHIPCLFPLPQQLSLGFFERFLLLHPQVDSGLPEHFLLLLPQVGLGFSERLLPPLLLLLLDYFVLVIFVELLQPDNLKTVTRFRFVKKGNIIVYSAFCKKKTMCYLTNRFQLVVCLYCNRYSGYE